MKALVLLGVLVVICAVLFLVGAFSPRRSRRMEKGFDRVALKAEEKSEDKGGRLGDATERGVDLMRRAADTSAEKGREAHQKLTP
jgi:hypothetical protein